MIQLKQRKIKTFSPLSSRKMGNDGDKYIPLGLLLFCYQSSKWWKIAWTENSSINMNLFTLFFYIYGIIEYQHCAVIVA